MPSQTPRAVRAGRPRQTETQVIGFHLPIPLAKAIKGEAARRQLALNALLEKMWAIYRENKRAG